MNARGFKKTERFTEQYSVRKELGSGAFGSVKLGKHRRSDVPCAIKIIYKTKLRERRVFQELNKNEFAVLEKTVHPNITRIYELMEDARCYYIIMELITGGNLFDKVRSL